MLGEMRARQLGNMNHRMKALFSLPLAVILSIGATVGCPTEASCESQDEAVLSKGGIALADGSFNPGLIIGAIEGLIIPAGILGPAWWEWNRREKEEEYKKNPETPEARQYFAGLRWASFFPGRVSVYGGNADACVGR